MPVTDRHEFRFKRLVTRPPPYWLEQIVHIQAPSSLASRLCRGCSAGRDEIGKGGKRFTSIKGWPLKFKKIKSNLGGIDTFAIPLRFVKLLVKTSYPLEIATAIVGIINKILVP